MLIVAKRRIPGVVKIVDRKSWVEICYSDDVKYCSQLRVVVDNAIIKVQEVFKHAGLEAPTIGFRCPICESKTIDHVTRYERFVNWFKSTQLSDIDDHYCILSFDQQTISCSRDESKSKTVSPDMTCWIHSEGKDQRII